MFNFPKCPKCNSTLPIATGVCAQCPQSPPPGHQDLDASLAAPAQVDQVGGTTWVFECIDCHWQCQQDELGPCIDLASDDELGCPVCGGCVFPAEAA